MRKRFFTLIAAAVILFGTGNARSVASSLVAPGQRNAGEIGLDPEYPEGVTLFAEGNLQGVLRVDSHLRP